MKALIITLTTLVTAMLTTMLFDWSFVRGHWTRVVIVCIFLVFQFAIGFIIVRESYTKKK